MNLMQGRRLVRRYWWQLILRGILAIVFGFLMFIWPHIGLIVLLALFGAWVFVDGLFDIAAAFEERRTQSRWWILLLEGLTGIIIGILTFVWAIITGIFEIVAAIWLSRAIRGEWWLALAGILSVIFGLIMFFSPRSFALAIVWLIAAYAIIFGIVLLIRAMMIRSLFDW